MMIPTLSHGGVNEGGEEKDDDHLGEAVDKNYFPSVLYNTYIQDIRGTVVPGFYRMLSQLLNMILSTIFTMEI